MLRFVGDGENACEVHKSQRGVYNTHHLWQQAKQTGIEHVNYCKAQSLAWWWEQFPDANHSSCRCWTPPPYSVSGGSTQSAPTKHQKQRQSPVSQSHRQPNHLNPKNKKGISTTEEEDAPRWRWTSGVACWRRSPWSTVRSCSSWATRCRPPPHSRGCRIRRRRGGGAAVPPRHRRGAWQRGCSGWWGASWPAFNSIDSAQVKSTAWDNILSHNLKIQISHELTGRTTTWQQQFEKGIK